MRTSTLLTSALAGALVAYFWGEFAYRTVIVLGVFRQVPSLFAEHETIAIADTAHCEDIHYHALSNTIFTACEDNVELRFKWFPPLGHFDCAELAAKSKGSIHVIDPQTMTSRRLRFENFDHIPAFITHGIDVITDPTDPKTVYIFALNHLPNPAWTREAAPDVPKARSQVELFHHVLGSDTVKHIRSIWSPLIRTPNDVLAVSLTSVYVSNDHFYRDGPMRLLEDVYFSAKWTDVIHLKLAASPETTSLDSSAGAIEATVAAQNLHIANGLGHGRTYREVLVASCTSGILNIFERSSEATDPAIHLVDEIRAETVIDNPSYFSDPYGPGEGGFVLPGIARPITLAETARDSSYDGPPKDPVMVWYATPANGTRGGKWEQRLLFADDGSRIRSASGALLVGIDPKQQKGADQAKRQAWLFVTGFISKNIIAVKVDL